MSKKINQNKKLGSEQVLREVLITKKEGAGGDALRSLLTMRYGASSREVKDYEKLVYAKQ